MIKKEKNNISIYVISFLYLIFYIFSPFSHYHHNDAIKEEGKIEYHTHLLQNVEKKTNTTECHPTIVQNDEHNHPVVSNFLVTNLQPRFVDSVNNLLFSNNITLEFKTDNGEISFNFVYHVGKTLKDKCVHFATNASPPFILAT